MAPKTIVISTTKDGDVGLVDFTFMHNGKKYKVTPKESNYGRLDAFFRFVKGPCERSGVNPFAFKGKEELNIQRIDAPGHNTDPKKTTPKTNQEGEQLSLKLARKVEIIASELTCKGLTKISEMLKPLAMGFRRGWLGPKSIAFFDDLSNANIQPEDAIKILDAYEGGAADGPQMAQATGLGLPVCGVVVALARRHDLVPMGRQAALTRPTSRDPRDEGPRKVSFTLPKNAIVVVLTDKDSNELWTMPLRNERQEVYFDDEDGPDPKDEERLKKSIFVPSEAEMGRLVKGAAMSVHDKAHGKMALDVVLKGDNDYERATVLSTIQPGQMSKLVRDKATAVVEKELSNQDNWKDVPPPEPDYESIMEDRSVRNEYHQ